MNDMTKPLSQTALHLTSVFPRQAQLFLANVLIGVLPTTLPCSKMLLLWKGGGVEFQRKLQLLGIIQYSTCNQHRQYAYAKITNPENSLRKQIILLFHLSKNA